MKENGFYIELIQECLSRIASYARNGKEEFLKSTLIQDAVVRNFERISDAAGKVSDEVKRQYSDVPWQELTALRKILLYPDMEAVWNTVALEVKILKEKFEKIPAEIQ